MMNSLYISVTGMSAFSRQIGVSSNNLANMETSGFKSGTTGFAELLTSSIGRVAGKSSGIGVAVQSVAENWTQGGISSAETPTYLAIDGWGMFAVKDPDTNQTFYTRDGAFTFNKTGALVANGGQVVQGYALDENGNAGPLTDVRVSYENFPPSPTTNMSATFNLDSTAEENETFQTTINVYDSLGNEIPLTVTYTKTATANEWDWAAEIPAKYGSISSGNSGTFTFDENGALVSGGDPVFELTLTNGAAPQTITWDVYDDGGDSNGGITQYSGESVLTEHDQDGYPAGELNSTEIDDSGRVVCTYSNGLTRTPFQIALADFANYNGLKKMDGNLYVSTLESGQAVLGRAGVGRFGDISAGSNELSNVDMATEMARLITSQTAYQACSRAFSVTNDLLEVLVNLK